MVLSCSLAFDPGVVRPLGLDAMTRRRPDPGRGASNKYGQRGAPLSIVCKTAAFQDPRRKEKREREKREERERKEKREREKVSNPSFPQLHTACV
jgi:hypothetical protein